jgi:hypothetical protein
MEWNGMIIAPDDKSSHCLWQGELKIKKNECSYFQKIRGNNSIKIENHLEL